MNFTIRQKITLNFTLLAGFLVLVSVILSLFVLQYFSSRSSYRILSNFLIDVTGNERQLTRDRNVSYQYSIKNNRSYYNINNDKYLEQTEKGSDNLADKSEEISEQLKNSTEIFSRYIAVDGSVISTSTLFETFPIDVKTEGNVQYTFGDICIHTITYKTNKGEIIQLARYCPFFPRELRAVSKTLVGSGLIMIAATYIFGLFLAKITIRPLEKELEAQKNFAREAKHELITPLAVAMSTVDAAIASHKFKDAIYALKEELAHAQGVLKLIEIKNTNQVVTNTGEVNLTQLVKKTLADFTTELKAKKIKIEQAGKAVIEGNSDVAKTLLRILIENSIVHGKKGSTVTIKIATDKLEIINQIGETNTRSGLGLNIAADLADVAGWQLKTKKHGEEFVAVVRFVRA